MKKPIILTILDGYGLNNNELGNAVIQGDNKVFTELWDKYPHTQLNASGTDVGLPSGQMGNSEVGHTNIGAGRVVFQPLQLINKAINDNTIYNNEKLINCMNHVKENNSKLHVIGLLSDGGVHSHINHLYAIIDMCKKENVQNVYYHLFLDGRDTLPNVKEKYLNELNKKIEEVNLGKIATISGRYYAMDRDNRWDRVELAYNAMVKGQGNKYCNYQELLQKEELTDEFVIPSVIDNNGMIEDNDGLIVFNYRPDRLREILVAITDETFNEFDTKKLNNIKLVTMMKVTEKLNGDIAFEKQLLNNTLGEYLANNGKSQLRIAETEKYAHVTYFFDGGVEKNLENAKRILISSPNVATYDLKPSMSANEITDALLENLEDFDFVVLNFANGDMVGHTGNLEAAKTAVEVVDKNLERIYKKIKELDGIMLITADHGNCEEMLDENGNVLTAHTTNKVPLIVTKENINLLEGKLADLAPTILKLMDIEKPHEMDGISLIKE